MYSCAAERVGKADACDIKAVDAKSVPLNVQSIGAKRDR